MKKIVALLLVFVMVLALCACGEAKPAETPVEETKPEEAAPVDDGQTVVEETPAEEPAAQAVMSFAEFSAAEVDAPVVVEAYVQAHQSWWDNKISVYAQDADGGYFFYDMACSEEDAAKLVPGTKIRVTGFKAEWSGEVEITDASFEFVDAEPWIAEPLDIAALLGTDELAAHMNQFICLKDAKIADKGDGAAFFFNWDNSGEDGNCDLYFDVEVNGGTYTFVVRRYLTAPGSEVYEAVKNLQVGDTVDIEGFLYWYEGPQPHISAITVK